MFGESVRCAERDGLPVSATRPYTVKMRRALPCKYPLACLDCNLLLHATAHALIGMLLATPAPPCRTHMAPTYSAFPFPKSLFEKFVKENDGGCACRGVIK